MTVWCGSKPKCDICGTVDLTIFIDGKTRMGPWANMCETCHDEVGVGLGTGRGQKYKKNDEGVYVKIEG